MCYPSDREALLTFHRVLLYSQPGSEKGEAEREEKGGLLARRPHHHQQLPGQPGAQVLKPTQVPTQATQPRRSGDGAGAEPPSESITHRVSQSRRVGSPHMPHTRPLCCISENRGPGQGSGHSRSHGGWEAGQEQQRASSRGRLLPTLHCFSETDGDTLTPVTVSLGLPGTHSRSVTH